MVRMAGTASEDQVPICFVQGRFSSAGLELRPKAEQSARANLGQENSQSSMSEGSRQISGQSSSRHRHTATIGAGITAAMDSGGQGFWLQAVTWAAISARRFSS